MPYGTLNAGTITPGSGNTLTINEIVDGTAIKDEDAMGSNSATHLATQQSIKAYVDSSVPTFGRVLRTAGNITTTSTSLTDVTGATVTITTGAFPVAYGAYQQVAHSATGGQVSFNVNIDGSMELGSVGLDIQPSNGGWQQNGSFSGLSVALSAGSHTIKMQWRVLSGTGTVFANTGVGHLFYAHEVR